MAGRDDCCLGGAAGAPRCVHGQPLEGSCAACDYLACHTCTSVQTLGEETAIALPLRGPNRTSSAQLNVSHLSQRRAAGEAIDPFRLTSKALGHCNINNTDAYLSFLEADIDQAILAS